MFKVLLLHERFVPAVIREDGVVQKVFHAVVDALRGISYPELREKIPVEVAYVRPVAEDDNTPLVVEVEKISPKGKPSI